MLLMQPSPTPSDSPTAEPTLTPEPTPEPSPVPSPEPTPAPDVVDALQVVSLAPDQWLAIQVLMLLIAVYIGYRLVSSL